MSKSEILVSIFLRLCFAAFLTVSGLIAAFMAGMSSDAGPNPVFFYLCLSVLLYVGTGIIILISPASFLFSSSKSSRFLWLIFLFSIVHPFIALVFAFFLDQPKTSGSTKVDFSTHKTSRICITQRSADPDNLAWVETAFGGTAFQRWPPNMPLKAGESRCTDYSIAPKTTFSYRAYQSTSSNARDLGLPPDDILSQEEKFIPLPGEPICLGVVPLKTPGHWKIVKEICSR